MSRFFEKGKLDDEQHWENLIAKETSFKFSRVNQDTFADIYQRIQEVKKLNFKELNQLAKNNGTLDTDLQIIMNTSCLMEKLDNEALAKHVDKFVSVAEYMIAHPEKASMVYDITASILTPFPWLKSDLMSSPLGQCAIVNDDIYAGQKFC